MRRSNIRREQCPATHPILKPAHNLYFLCKQDESIIGTGSCPFLLRHGHSSSKSRRDRWTRWIHHLYSIVSYSRRRRHNRIPIRLQRISSYSSPKLISRIIPLLKPHLTPPANPATAVSSHLYPVLRLGIWSGFVITTSSPAAAPGYKRANSMPSFTVTVNDTNPAFFYCAQIGHCNLGMVFALNPSV